MFKNVVETGQIVILSGLELTSKNDFENHF